MQKKSFETENDYFIKKYIKMSDFSHNKYQQKVAKFYRLNCRTIESHSSGLPNNLIWNIAHVVVGSKC
jgi:hypothetical protein